jgi:hypothetical protein
MKREGVRLRDDCSPSQRRRRVATEQPIPRRDDAVAGLALPAAILREVFYENAARWIPGIDRSCSG